MRSARTPPCEWPTSTIAPVDGGIVATRPAPPRSGAAASHSEAEPPTPARSTIVRHSLMVGIYGRGLETSRRRESGPRRESRGCPPEGARSTRAQPSHWNATQRLGATGLRAARGSLGATRSIAAAVGDRPQALAQPDHHGVLGIGVGAGERLRLGLQRVDPLEQQPDRLAHGAAICLACARQAHGPAAQLPFLLLLALHSRIIAETVNPARPCVDQAADARIVTRVPGSDSTSVKPGNMRPMISRPSPHPVDGAAPDGPTPSSETSRTTAPASWHRSSEKPPSRPSG